MEKELFTIQQAILMKGIGLTVKLQAKVHTRMSTGLFIRVHGGKINKKETELKNGRMALIIKDNITRELKWAKEKLNLRMVRSM